MVFPGSSIQGSIRGALVVGGGALLVLAPGCRKPSSRWILQTDVPSVTLTAGDRVDARCTLLKKDRDGTREVTDKEIALEVVYQHPDSFSTDEDGEVIAVRAGAASAACAAPELGVVDPDPVKLQIVPGAARRVHTQLATDDAVAGVEVAVSCRAFDAFDNELTEFDRQIATSPSGGGVSTQADSVTATTADDYEVSCMVPAAAEVETDFLHVRPGLPASIAAAVTPERAFYSIDEQVKLLPVVRDAFGNRVDDVELTFDADPPLPSPFEARFLFDQDGAFVLSAEVVSGTQNDVLLKASVPVNVDTSGPVIDCMRADDPLQAAEAYMVQHAPGDLVVPVRVSDDFNVASVTVAGVPATFDAGTGNYQASVPVPFGMSFLDVVATDALGLESSTTCFVLAAEYYAPEDDPLDGTVALRLDQAAVDGGPQSLDSLGDVLQTVLESDALRQLVDSGLAGSNPINDGSCGFFACNPDVNYTAGSLYWGTPGSSLTLIPGGLRVVLSIPNVGMNVRACGTTCCPGGADLDVTASSIQATVDFALQLQGGQLRASVVGSPSVGVNGVSLDGSGVCGFVIDLVQGLFIGVVEDELEGALADYISTDVGPILDDMVSSLDISTLGQSFSVPRLDGVGTTDLQFALAMSSLDITSTRLLLGIGTRFTATPVTNVRPSLGVAGRLPTALLDPPGTSGSQPVGLAVYEGALNQVLHGLWRGGYFQADLDLGGQGSAVLDARLPPVVAISSSNEAELMLGGVAAVVSLPGVLSEPVALTFGGRASATISLNGGDLEFGGLTLDEVFVATETPLTQGQRDALESFLSTILQGLLVDSINDGLPALPIPTFTLPDSVTEFGLPAGAELGITAPALSTTGSHAVLTGGFGVQP